MISSNVELAGAEYTEEAERLYGLLGKAGYRYEDCETIAPYTYEINRLKKEKNAIVLAHHYMTPDIIFGIADYAEDALGLLQRAEETDADIIVMCSVMSLAECVKIAVPDKTVLCPSFAAGCSVADSMTLEQLRALKAENPGVPAVAYITTSAEVKSESDYIVTSANLAEVIEKIPSDKVLLYPDHAVAKSMSEESNKEIIAWDGTCVVHDNYTLEQVAHFRETHPDTHVLFHSEVDPEIYAHGDMHGGTRSMKQYVADHPEVDSFFMVTECGLSDQLRVEFPDKKFIGTCSLCPFMKKVELENTLMALDDDLFAQEVVLTPEILKKSYLAYERTDKLLNA